MLQTVARSVPPCDKPGNRERITCSCLCPTCNKRLSGHIAEKTCTTTQKIRSLEKRVMQLRLQLMVSASKSCLELSVS